MQVMLRELGNMWTHVGGHVVISFDDTALEEWLVTFESSSEGKDLITTSMRAKL